MNIKEKIKALKKRSIEIAMLAATMLPTQSVSAPNLNKDKKITSIEQTSLNDLSDNKVNIIDEEITLSIADFKKVLDENPDINLSSDLLENIQPGPSKEKIHSILSKGFHYTIRNSRGESKEVFASLNQNPQGYCAGAVKRLLNRVYKEPISNNLSACQEKNNLSESPRFMSVPLANIKEVKKCPPNTVVVIPKCDGHEYGHILVVIENGVYCSDGKEVAGEYFENNYKDAQGIYAFVPIDGSIKLTPQTLEKSPELCAAVLSLQTGKDVQLASGTRQGEPIMFTERVSTPKDNNVQPLIIAANYQKNTK